MNLKKKKIVCIEVMYICCVVLYLNLHSICSSSRPNMIAFCMYSLWAASWRGLTSPLILCLPTPQFHYSRTCYKHIKKHNFNRTRCTVLFPKYFLFFFLIFFQPWNDIYLLPSWLDLWNCFDIVPLMSVDIGSFTARPTIFRKLSHFKSRWHKKVSFVEHGLTGICWNTLVYQ